MTDTPRHDIGLSINQTKRACRLRFFFDPDPDVDLSPLPGCLSPGGEPKYPPATSLSHLIDKIGESFSYRNETE